MVRSYKYLLYFLDSYRELFDYCYFKYCFTLVLVFHILLIQKSVVFIYNSIKYHVFEKTEAQPIMYSYSMVANKCI